MTTSGALKPSSCVGALHPLTWSGWVLVLLPLVVVLAARIQAQRPGHPAGGGGRRPRAIKGAAPAPRAILHKRQQQHTACLPTRLALSGSATSDCIYHHLFVLRGMTTPRTMWCIGDGSPSGHEKQGATTCCWPLLRCGCGEAVRRSHPPVKEMKTPVVNTVHGCLWSLAICSQRAGGLGRRDSVLGPHVPQASGQQRPIAHAQGRQNSCSNCAGCRLYVH